MHELDRGFPTESKTENKCVSIEQPPQQIVCNLLVLIQSLFFQAKICLVGVNDFAVAVTKDADLKDIFSFQYNIENVKRS